MDDNPDLIIAFYELVTLTGCIAAGIVFKAWWKAIGFAILWVLLPAFLVGSYLNAGQDIALAVLFAFVKFQLAAAVVLTALSSLAAHAVRKHRARRTAASPMRMPE